MILGKYTLSVLLQSIKPLEINKIIKKNKQKRRFTQLRFVLAVRFGGKVDNLHQTAAKLLEDHALGGSYVAATLLALVRLRNHALHRGLDHVRGHKVVRLLRRRQLGEIRFRFQLPLGRPGHAATNQRKRRTALAGADQTAVL